MTSQPPASDSPAASSHSAPSASQPSALYAVADFCLIPMGTGVSVGGYIAECQRVLERYRNKGLLRYEMHGYGTNLEGSWQDVSRAIEECHQAVHDMGAPRIATDIRIGTRVDKPPPALPSPVGQHDPNQEGRDDGGGENERKRESVRRILAGQT